MKVEVWQKDMKIIGEYATKLGVPTPLFSASAPVSYRSDGAGLRQAGHRRGVRRARGRGGPQAIGRSAARLTALIRQSKSASGFAMCHMPFAAAACVRNLRRQKPIRK